MRLRQNKARRWALMTAAGALLAGPAMADAASIRFRAGSDRRSWVPPAHRQQVTRVWVEPVYEVRVRKVWVPPLFEKRWVERAVPAVVRMRQVPVYGRGGRVVAYRTVKEVVRPARTVRQEVRVKVREGRYKRIEERVLVKPGHEKVIRQKVPVREGYYRSRGGPAGEWGKGFSFSFGFRT